MRCHRIGQAHCIGDHYFPKQNQQNLLTLNGIKRELFSDASNDPRLVFFVEINGLLQKEEIHVATRASEIKSRRKCSFLPNTLSFVPTFVYTTDTRHLAPNPR